MDPSNLRIRILIVLFILAGSLSPGTARGQGMVSRVGAASFTVNSTDDAWDVNPGDGACATSNGKCTLRAAILETNALPGADTIVLPAGNFQMTVAGTLEDDSVTGDLDIRGDLTISGAGKNTTIIDVKQLDRAIDIQGTGLTVQLADLTIQNGFNQDTQNWDRGGAGIYVPSGSTLILNNIVIYNNKDRYSLSPFGGGIYSRGELMLNDTAVISNTAMQGGGIASLGKLTMTDGQIDENDGGGIWIGGEASLDSVSISGNNYSSGGGINNNGTLTITESTISGNSAQGEGGGIWSNGTLVMIDCLVTGNEVTRGSGGGISNTYSYGQLTLIHSTVSNNTAATYGGGIDTRYSQGPLTIVNSQIISNTVLNGDGGGIYGAPYLMIDSTVSGNQIWGGGGAGIYQEGYSWSVSEYINTTLDRNFAWNGNGGGIYNLSTIKMTNSTISGNQAAQHGGGVFNAGSLNLNNATVTLNVADSDSNETGNGGGILNDSGTVTLMHTILGENKDNSTVINYPDCDGTFTSQGYNLIETVSPLCSVQGDLTGNLTGISPELGPLQDNGGPTYTHLPLAGSPVLDAGNPAGCTDADGDVLMSDQRGVSRPLDSDGDGVSICDLGAVEMGVLANLPPGVTQTLVYTDTHRNTTTIQVPVGAITETVDLAFSPVVTVTTPLSFTFIQHAFALSVYRDDVALPGFEFQTPVTITIQYAPQEIGLADEEQLQLMLFNGEAWMDAAATCDPPAMYHNDPDNNTVSLPVCRTGLYGIFGPTRPLTRVFLPMVLKE